MKKIFLVIIIALFFAGSGFAQKVNITLVNPRVDGSGYFAMDVQATVLAAQTWKVGSSNIRIGWASTPPAGISVKADNPVSNANPNLNSGNYSAMTTTSISGGGAISLNITRLGACHTFTPGIYVLGTIRFNRIITGSNVTLTINPNSVLQDSITQLQNPAGWTLTNPAGVLVNTATLASEIPTEFNLYQNYPNPFNPSTRVKFDIPELSIVKVKIYNSLGKEVAVLVDEQLAPGAYEVEWNASSMPSGAYFYRITAGEFTKTYKMMLTK
jgi:hypothetical protein